MLFNVFGNKNNKSVVLVHGVLTPWQIWERQIEVLRACLKSPDESGYESKSGHL